jgi:hypothetical protein
MPDFSKLFDFSYILHPNPGKLFPLAPYILCFFALLVAIAIVLFVALRVIKPNPVLKRILRKTPTRLFAFGITGVVLVLLRLGEAAYLSMRAWLVIWGILFIWYITTIVLMFQKYPEELRQFHTKITTRSDRLKQAEMIGKKKRK